MPPPPSRAWIRLPSGRRLDLLSPTPLDWTDEDLAIGLSRTFRWGGHSVWPGVPLSVAQHSLAVLALLAKAGVVAARADARVHVGAAHGLRAGQADRLHLRRAGLQHDPDGGQRDRLLRAEEDQRAGKDLIEEQVDRASCR